MSDRVNLTSGDPQVDEQLREEEVPISSPGPDPNYNPLMSPSLTPEEDQALRYQSIWDAAKRTTVDQPTSYGTYQVISQIPTQEPARPEGAERGEQGRYSTLVSPEQYQEFRGYGKNLARLVNSLDANNVNLSGADQLRMSQVLADYTGINQQQILDNLEHYSKYLVDSELPMEGSWSIIRDLFKTGRMARDASDIGNRLFQGETPELWEEYRALQEQMPDVEWHRLNIFQKAIGGAAKQVAMMMIEPTAKGLAGGAAGALLGRGIMAVGAATGFAVPAAIVGTMFSLGRRIGTMSDMFALERGLTYTNLREMGIQEEIARPLSNTAAAGISALEMFGLEHVPGIRQLNSAMSQATQKMLLGGLSDVAIRGASGAGAMTLASVAARGVAGWAGNTAFEATVEVAQEVVSIGMEEFGKNMQGRWTREMLANVDLGSIGIDEGTGELDDTTVAAVMDRLKSTWIDSALSFAVIGAAGSVAETVTSGRQLTHGAQAEMFQAAVKKLQDAREFDETSVDPSINDDEVQAVLADDKQVVNEVFEKMRRGETVTAEEFLMAENATTRIQSLEARSARMKVSIDTSLVADQDIQDAIDNEEIRTTIKDNFTRLNNEHVTGAIMALGFQAKGLGLTTSEYFNKFQFTADEAEATAANKGAIPENVKGMTVFIDEGRALVYAAKKADISTFLHETSHVARRLMTGDLKTQTDAAFGVEDGVWTEAQEEQYARGFEYYMRYNLAQSDAHRGIFAKVRDWLSGIYGEMKKWEINTEMAKSFDALLGFSTAQTPTYDTRIKTTDGTRLETFNTGERFEMYGDNGVTVGRVDYDEQGGRVMVHSLSVDDGMYEGTQDQLMRQFVEDSPTWAEFDLSQADDATRAIFNRVAPGRATEAEFVDDTVSESARALAQEVTEDEKAGYQESLADGLEMLPDSERVLLYGDDRQSSLEHLRELEEDVAFRAFPSNALFQEDGEAQVEWSYPVIISNTDHSPDSIRHMLNRLDHDGVAVMQREYDGDLPDGFVRDYSPNLKPIIRRLGPVSAAAMTQSYESPNRLYQDETQVYVGDAMVDISEFGGEVVDNFWGIRVTKSLLPSALKAIKAAEAANAKNRRQLGHQISDVARSELLEAMMASGDMSVVTIGNAVAGLRKMLSGTLSDEARAVINQDIETLTQMVKGWTKIKGMIVRTTLVASPENIVKGTDQIPKGVAEHMAATLEARGFEKIPAWIRESRDNLDYIGLYNVLTKNLTGPSGDIAIGMKKASDFFAAENIRAIEDKKGMLVTSPLFLSNADVQIGLKQTDEDAQEFTDRKGIEDAIVRGEVVPMKMLEAEKDSPIVAAEINTRRMLDAMALGYSSVDEFLEEAQQMDGYERPDEYYASVWTDSEYMRSRVDPDVLAERFLKVMDDETLKLVLGDIASVHAEDEILRIAPDLVKISRKIVAGKNLTKTDLKKAHKALREHPVLVIRAIESLEEDSEVAALVDEATRAIQIDELMFEAPLKADDTNSGIVAKIDRVKRRVLELEERIASMREDARDDKRGLKQKYKEDLRAEREKLKTYYTQKARIDQLIRRIMQRPSKATNIDQAQEILDLQATYNPRVSERMRLLVTAAKSANIVAGSPSAQVALDKRLSRQDMQLMKVEALEDLYDRIETLRKEGREAYKQKLAIESDLIHKARAKLLEAVGGEVEKLPGAGSRAARKLRKTSGFKSIAFTTLRPERVAMLLDGNKEGEWYNWFWTQANEATNEKLRHVKMRVDAGLAEMDRLGIRPKDLAEMLTFDGIELSVDEAISLYIGMQDDYNRDAIIYGNNISLETVKKFTDSLTPQQKEWGDWMIDSFGGEEYNRLQSVFTQDTNTAMRKVERYFPMLRADVFYRDLNEQVADDMLSRTGRTLQSAKVNKGFTISRVRINPKRQTAIRLGATSIWQEQLDKQEHYISHGMLIKRMKRLLNSPEMGHALTDKFGDLSITWLEAYIKHLAHPNIYDAHDALQGVSRVLRRNVQVAALAFNGITALKQLPSIGMYLPYSGPMHLVSSAIKFAARPKYYLDRAKTLDPQVEARAINQATEELALMNKEGLAGVQQKVASVGMTPIRWMDMMAVTVGWNAVFEKALAKGASQDEAVALAQKATLRTQPAARAKDLAWMYRGGEVTKWFTMFSNQLNQIWNIITYDMWHGTAENKAQFAFMSAMSVAFSALVIGSISRRGLPEEPKEVAEDLLKGLIAAIPLIGRGVNAGMEGWMGNGVNPFPISEDIGRLLDDMFDDEPGWDIALKDTLRLLEEATKTFGVPGSVAALRSVRAYQEQAEQTDPWGVEDVGKIFLGGERR